MDSDLKFTGSNEEIPFMEMVAGDQILNIPLFQRSYKWTSKNIDQYWLDIMSIIDGTARSHFMGVLVLVPQPRPVGRPQLLDIVDGQQRLSTCYLTVMAISEVAINVNALDWAVDVIKQALVTRQFSGQPVNTRLIPSAADRQQFALLWSRLLNLKALEGAQWQGSNPTPPQPSGSDSGRMMSAYDYLRKKVKEYHKNNGFDGIQQLFQVVSENLSFVTINLRSPSAAPVIFERLNARGEKISISDLVRNDIFAKVADNPTLATSIFSNYWEPFVAEYERREIEFERMLFPYGLTIDSNVTKSELFQSLRRRWHDISDPKEVIRDLRRFEGTFFTLEAGSDNRELPRPLTEKLLELNKMGAPSSIYPFLFLLSESVLTEKTNVNVACNVIDVVISFLVRRAIAGYEPTGLHAVFKGLWKEAKAHELDDEAVRHAIGRRGTVPWPKDHEMKQAICSRPIRRSNIHPYLLYSYETSLNGETPSDEYTVEHVYPQTYSKEWEKIEGEQNENIIDTWGNLILLSKKMNPSISNAGFMEKRSSYENSIFASAREVARKYDRWGIEQIKVRNVELADWAVKRWRYSF
jgi:Protein of unknown function DUF262/Protein of unknown function (DUF1524)